MLIKICKIPEGSQLPAITRNAAGEMTLDAPMIGELVLVPDQLYEFCEQLVGEFTMSYLPLGIEIHVGGELDGLWVQREILNAAKAKENESGRTAAVAN